jgi:hypothetical protein
MMARLSARMMRIRGLWPRSYSMYSTMFLFARKHGNPVWGGPGAGITFFDQFPNASGFLALGAIIFSKMAYV